MGNLVRPFLDNEFLQKAFLAGVLVSLTCAVVGTYVVLRGMAFIGDALAHGVLPGVAGALMIGMPAMAGAAVGAAVMVGGVGLITSRSKLSNDTAIGDTKPPDIPSHSQDLHQNTTTKMVVMRLPRQRRRSKALSTAQQDRWY